MPSCVRSFVSRAHMALGPRGCRVRARRTVFCSRMAEPPLARSAGPSRDSDCLRTGEPDPSGDLRVNLLQITREELLRRLEKAGIQGKPTRVSPAGITLVEGGSVAMPCRVFRGQFYVEDEAAQLIPSLLDVRPGDLVLDACAAPGGRATHIAELMED